MGWGQGMAGIPAEAPWGPADATFDPIFGVNWQKHYSDAEDQRSAMNTIKSHQHSPNAPLCEALERDCCHIRGPCKRQAPVPGGLIRSPGQETQDSWPEPFLRHSGRPEPRP